MACKRTYTFTGNNRMKDFIVDQSGFATTCFPDGLDISSFIDVTCIGDSFSKFIAPSGKVHDCKIYHEELFKEYKRITKK